MADFKVIETQEQLDAIIKDRLERQEKKLKETFSNYLSPDDVASEKEGLLSQISELTQALEEEKGKATGYTTQIEDLTKQVKTYERNSVKNRISAELGIPYELAQRLNGDTEEEIRKDAESLKGIIGKTATPPPLAKHDGDNTENADMRAFARALKGE